jgi:tetratricopeptide (TPR) repeat protein
MSRITTKFLSFIAFALLLSFSSFAQDLKSAIKLTDSEQFEQANQMFVALTAKEPANGDVYYYFGEMFLKERKTDTSSLSLKEATTLALTNFNKGIEVEPGNPLNYVGVGRVDILLGKETDATANFEKAKALLPFKNYKNSPIPLWKQAMTYSKIAEAMIKSTNRTLATQLELIESALVRDPKSMETYLIKGDVYLENNDGSNAIVAYNKANDLDPTSCKAMVKIGQLWVRGKSYPDAIKYFNDALKIDTTFAPAYRELGELYGLAGQFDKGIIYYQKFVALSGNNTAAKVRYASFLFMNKDYDGSIKLINEIFTIDSKTPYAYLLYRLQAYSYFETKQYSLGLPAIENFFSVINPDKILSSDYSYYGKLLSKNGKDSLAVEKFKLALELDPTALSLYGDMGKSYSNLKKYAEAAKSYENKIAKEATLIDYYELGKCFMNMKEWWKADTAFAKVLESKPDFYNALKYRAQLNVSIEDSIKVPGLAKPYYESLITLALKDSAKYSKDLASAYSYLRFYYYKQWNLNKKCEDGKNSIMYCDKILAIDPKDEAAKTTKSMLKSDMLGKCPQ